MIKLNLLPPYVPERPKILKVIVTFVILLALQGGVVFKFYADQQALATWYPGDQAYYDQRKATIAGEAAKASEIAGKANAYTAVVNFHKRTAILEYNTKLATLLKDVADKVGVAQGVWCTDLTIQQGGALELNGTVVGLMNFVEYYFTRKDAGFTIQPAAQPYPAPVTQRIPLKMTGSVSAIPTPLTPPGTYGSWTELYKSAGSAAAGGSSE